MAVLALLIAAALQTGPSLAPPKIDCGDAAHRAFDFWIGDWDVTPTGSTQVIARSRIEKIVGCAISETYDQSVGPKGQPVDYHGRSISTFDPASGAWHQFYVDSGGSVAALRGGIVDGAMVFDSDKGSAKNRMTIRRNPDGTVRQSGQTSSDGKTWTATFDFTYRPRANAGGN